MAIDLSLLKDELKPFAAMLEPMIMNLLKQLEPKLEALAEAIPSPDAKEGAVAILKGIESFFEAEVAKLAIS